MADGGSISMAGTTIMACSQQMLVPNQDPEFFLTIFLFLLKHCDTHTAIVYHISPSFAFQRVIQKLVNSESSQEREYVLVLQLNMIRFRSIVYGLGHHSG